MDRGSWTITPLRSLIEFYIGGGWGKECPQAKYLSPAFVIRGTDIPPLRNGDVSSCPRRFHTASNLRSRMLQDGDLVFEVSGGSKDQPVGRTMHITDRLLNKFSDQVMCASFCKLIRPKHTNTAPRFLFYYLNGIYNSREITQWQVQSTGLSNFQFENFLDELTLTIPPLPTQRKIAAILSAYDDLIENNLRRIQILEEMAQNIYREWFVNFRFPGHEKMTFVDSSLGMIPEGWEVAPVKDVIAINPREKVPRATSKLYVPMGSLSTNSMLIGEVEKRTGSAGSKFRNGDTLFARITPCLENGKTAFVQFLDSDESIALGSTEFMVLRSKNLCPELVYLMAREESFRENAIKSMTGASGRQRVSKPAVEQFLIIKPTSATTSSFQDLIRPMFTLIHQLSCSNANLRQSRDLLLPKLISGQLDVSDLDIEIPEDTA